MSEENVEIVRRYFKVGPKASDLPALVAEFWESDGDYYPVRGFREARPCHGREEIEAFLAESREPFDFRVVVKDARAIGDDRVFVHGRMSGEGRANDATLEGDLYCCCWLRHGRFIRVEDHLTEKEALHALGFGGEALEAAGLQE